MREIIFTIKEFERSIIKDLNESVEDLYSDKDIGRDKKTIERDVISLWAIYESDKCRN